MQGFFPDQRLLLGTDDLDFDAAIGLQAFNHLLALCALALVRLGHWLLLALAFGIDAIGFDTFADQVVLHGGGTALGKLLVVRIGPETVGMADGNDDLKLDVVHLGYDIVKLGLAFRTQDGLVEVEQRVRRQCDLLGGRLGCGRRSGCRRRCRRGRWRGSDLRGLGLLDEIGIAFFDRHGGGPESRPPAQAVATLRNVTTLVNGVTDDIFHVDARGLGQGGTADAKKGGEQQRLGNWFHYRLPRGKRIPFYICALCGLSRLRKRILLCHDSLMLINASMAMPTGIPWRRRGTPATQTWLTSSRPATWTIWDAGS